MADDDVIEDDEETLATDPADEEFDEDDVPEDGVPEDEVIGAELDEPIEEDLTIVDPDADIIDEEADEGTTAAPVVEKARSTDDEDDDEDDPHPDDVEEDLDTILRDRIASGTDEEEDEDEEVVTDDRSETGDRVSPRRPEEVSCPECFLLVRSSQFSGRRADCPGGLDVGDCPMPAVFGRLARK